MNIKKLIIFIRILVDTTSNADDYRDLLRLTIETQYKQLSDANPSGSLTVGNVTVEY